MSFIKVIIGALRIFGGAAALGASVWSSPAQAPSAPTPPGHEAVVVEIEGPVEVSRVANVWDRAYTNQVLHAGDRLRTLERARALVNLSGPGLLRVGELSLLEMPPEQTAGFSLLRGVANFFHRGQPGTVPIRTPTLTTLIRGTEFTLAVASNGGTTLTLFDGEVEMTNEFGRITLSGGEQGIAEPRQPPRRTAVLFAVNVIQWALYYPAVLDLIELELPDPAAARDSIESYRRGDVLAALAKYPAGRQPASPEERLFLSALLLSVGQAENAQAMLGSLPTAGQRPGRPARLANALRQLIAATKLEEWEHVTDLATATEWLAESYYRQSRSDLAGSLDAARNAVRQDTAFGFAWARVAELEFGFGRVAQAKAALERALELSPRNAQAMALRGFLLAAENRIPAAITAFNEAIAMDGALGNAWLGRGLCRIRRGQAAEGLADLEAAAALEPNRALLRSYLGKAFSHAGNHAQATSELALARRLDANDPTAWLYSALLNQQRNRINQAVRDLERSQELNDNRRVYRSRLMLDQDRAVRGANLANVYLDAGLVDVSGREAARAVSADYANYSAHLFLAHSFDALRDPRQVNLRYETPWLSEYLVANLLAPVGAGTLSPVVTQNEYSKLFERDRFGLASATEYTSRGDWLQAAAQYGTWRNTAYAAEVAYRSEKGDRPNNDLEQLTFNLHLKHEITQDDGLYFQAIYYDAEAGDLTQHYDPDTTNPTLRIKERQEPILIAGYHHQWAPGSHTLLLAGRLDDTVLVTNNRNDTLLFDRSLDGSISDVITTLFDQKYRSELEIYTLEGQQIWQAGPQTAILGARFQSGVFESQNTQGNPRYPIPIPLTFTRRQDVSPDFERFNFYGYDYWRVHPALLLEAGVSYDRIRFPVNHRFGPVTAQEDERDQVSPKAGLVWTPLANTTVRGAVSRGRGGVSFDQSFQLEPSQVAGFNQAFRSLVPEAAAGAIPAPPFEMAGLSLEQKFGRGTYVGLSGEWLKSDASREIGVYEFKEIAPGILGIAPASTSETLNYRERSLVFSLHQLVGDEWSVVLRYRLSQAELESRFPGIPALAGMVGPFQREQSLASMLRQLNLFAIYSHPSGFFAQLGTLWTAQSNSGYSPARPGDDFWQFNAYAGYRFLDRRAEIRLGLLNFTDQDYRLNPLNLTAYLPRERTFTMSLRFNF